MSQTETTFPAVPEFIQGEILSESTLPLLSYFLACKESPDAPRAKLFRRVKSGVGVADRPIPDESEQLRPALIKLIETGPGQSGQALPGTPTVTIVGAGVSGLCAGYELKKAGFDVQIFEASSRVGGRVVTFREPTFAHGLHGEGGAMRIPGNHYLLHKYIQDFNLHTQLFDFEMKNKFIYIAAYGETITYDYFNTLLGPEAKLKTDKEKHDKVKLLKLFPDLKPEEKDKTCDELFAKAVERVVTEFWREYDEINKSDSDEVNVEAVKKAYEAITRTYDKYSLRSYLTEIAKWSEDAVNLYDLGNAHVVFENGFIESFKDAFLSSNTQGDQAKMKQLQEGMDVVPNAFVSTERGKDSLIDNITFGARVLEIGPVVNENPGIPTQTPIKITYELARTGHKQTITSDFLILAIPYTSQRAIAKTRAFQPKQEMAIRDVRYVEVTKILLQYKERWWEKIFSDPKYGKQGQDGGLVSDLPIRYTMFPKTQCNSQFKHSKRGVVMAAYTFEQDATILGSLSADRRIQIAAENLNRIFPEAKSLDLLEAGASQVFPADELAGGSAFCYFGPEQKSKFLTVMQETDWENRVFFAGEQCSFTHGWIQGALEAGLRCVQQVWNVAVAPKAQ